jgi:hypothetical protein
MYGKASICIVSDNKSRCYLTRFYFIKTSVSSTIKYYVCFTGAQIFDLLVFIYFIVVVSFFTMPTITINKPHILPSDFRFA